MVPHRESLGSTYDGSRLFFASLGCRSSLARNKVPYRVLFTPLGASAESPSISLIHAFRYNPTLHQGCQLCVLLKARTRILLTRRYRPCHAKRNSCGIQRARRRSSTIIGAGYIGRHLVIAIDCRSGVQDGPCTLHMSVLSRD